MTPILIFTAGELTRDPRARRQVEAALHAGARPIGVCLAGAPPAEMGALEVVRVGRGGEPARPSAPPRRRGALEREARGLARLARLALRTAALVRAARQTGPAEIVHANDFDTLPAAFLLARRLRARLVYDAHELYTGFEAEPPRLYNLALRSLEGALARRAAAVVTVSDGIADRLQATYGLAHRPAVVLNCPPWAPAPPRAPATPLRAVYQAAVGPGRHLEDVLDAAAACEGAHIALRVAGADPGALRAEIDRRGLTQSVMVLDPVEPGALAEALLPFDAGLVIDRPGTDNVDLALPNKLFEYLMAGLAVVVPGLASMRALVEAEGVGVVYEPGSATDLGRALTQLATDPAATAAMRERALAAAEHRYNAAAQASVLLQAWGL